MSAWPHRPCCGRGFAAGSVFGMMGLVLLPCLFGARPAGAVAADPGVGRSAWIRGFPRQPALSPEADLRWSAKACNVFQATAARKRKRLAGREANPFKTITFKRFDLPCG